MQSREILGVKVDFGLDYNSVLDKVENTFLKDNKTHYICTTNPEFIMDAQKNPNFKAIINESDLSVPDGAGVLYANAYLEGLENIRRDFLFPVRALFLGLSLGLKTFISTDVSIGTPVRGVDLVNKFAELANARGYTMFLLGGWPRDKWGKKIVQDANCPDLASVATNRLKEKYPNLKIVGATSKFSYKESDDVATLDFIHTCMKEHAVESIDFIFVAYNQINQESWITRNKDKIPVKVSMGVGGSLDYITGHQKLTPDNLLQKNLGWIYRLVSQPWRYKRIFMAFPLFPFILYIKTLYKK